MSRANLLMAAAVLALSFGTAQAEDKPEMRVRTSDLNLTLPKDAHRLYDRVYEAATEVCGGGPLVFFSPAPPQSYLDCRDATLDAALSRVHAPLVQALRKPKADQAAAAPQS
jgi:UrcA family protein